MSSTSRMRTGLLLVLLACVGVVFMAWRFDRSFVERDVPAGKHASWRPDGGGRAQLSLGRFALPAPGVLRASLCRKPPGEARATLRVHDAVSGELLASVHFERDRSQGERCYDAQYRTDGARVIMATIVAADSGSARGFSEVEVAASRQITPLAMWPAFILLSGFLLFLYAPQAPSQSTKPGPTPSLAVEPLLTEDPEPPEPAGVIEPSPTPLVDRRWSSVLALAVFIAIHLAVGVASATWMLMAGLGSTGSGTFSAFVTLMQHGLLALSAAWLLGAFEARRDPREALGLAPLRLREALPAAGLAALLVAVAIVVTHFIRDVSGSPLGRMLQRVPVRYVIGFGALLAPMSEELFFRGVLVRVFGKRSAGVGVLGATLVFTLAHAAQLGSARVGLIPIAAVALVNGWLRVRSGGVAQPWMVHTLYNAALSVGLFVGLVI